ncbi:dTDP-4-dehydrorhamnose reductase family protein [Roseateles sp.]|uniref:dTDP-4-dehydrorhamnose reductase family protein n=1 Tax=Roseateles sp. TaxID=1971397 RepID=UPI003948985B
MTEPTLLVMGANGMLGHVVLRWFASRGTHRVVGTVRNDAAAAPLRAQMPHAELRTGVDATNLRGLRALFDAIKPSAVINCVGMVKQLAGADSPATAIPVNAMLPHRLSRLCGDAGVRLVHISTDCVFSGSRGRYTEADTPDAEDLYGRTKLMGEVEAPHAVTLRTSIIGPELNTTHALLGWFLASKGTVPGFSNAIFSALPTVELARVIDEHVLANPALQGIYHVVGPSINKCDLLRLVAKVYRSDTRVSEEPNPVVDRSLDGRRFEAATGYRSADWPELLEGMRAFS